MAKRRTSNSFTTICVKWTDKEVMRKYASFIKKTKTGEMYESDADVFAKMLVYYIQHHEAGEAKPTYPSKIPDKSLPDSIPVEPILDQHS